jgi:hypothetical protein
VKDKNKSSVVGKGHCKCKFGKISFH